MTLHEASAQLGGQALLAQALPGREEFGGIVTNLAAEMERAGVAVCRNSVVTAECRACGRTRRCCRRHRRHARTGPTLTAPKRPMWSIPGP